MLCVDVMAVFGLLCQRMKSRLELCSEDTLELVECFNSITNSCPLISDCKLNRVLMRAMKNFMDEMDIVTIDDITSNQKNLLALLQP
jgi:Rrf2 family nitric oxide-sensitive transcriptional repressor